MLGWIIFSIILGALLMYALAYFTVLIEVPFIMKCGITQNKTLATSLNVFTNACFNTLTLIICLVTRHIFMIKYDAVLFIWTGLAEIVIIPLIEICAYLKVTSVSRKRVIIVTYIANLESFILGAVLFGPILYALCNYYGLFREFWILIELREVVGI